MRSGRLLTLPERKEYTEGLINALRDTATALEIGIAEENKPDSEHTKMVAAMAIAEKTEGMLRDWIRYMTVVEARRT